jgi:inhibitor of cysteine peptidase
MQGTAGTGRGRKEAAVFVLVIFVLSGIVAVASFSTFSTTHNSPASNAVPQGLGAFESASQLHQYVEANAKSAQRYASYGIGLGVGFPVDNMGLPGAFMGAATALTMAAAASTPSFTGTNVQVQGVDEPDRVKTDGTHLFVSSGNLVSVIDAYPPTSTSVVASIKFSDANVLGLEISPARLMVIDQRVSNASYIDLLLYDTSTVSAPRLIQNVSVAGSYVAARLAQGYFYAVIQQPSYVFGNGSNATAVMPSVSENGVETGVAPTSVYHTSNVMQISYYSMIVSISMDTGKNTVVSVLTGPSATVYVSTSNIYVVYTNYLDLYDTDGVPGDMWTGGVITSADVQQAQNSTILRAAYSDGVVTVAAAGVIPGTVLNQFSLDEYDGYFRVATSRFAMVGGAATTSDDVYVLDQGMHQVSALRNIAPGENLYAVRFVGEMGYVVTFVQIDPLFVISFKDMTNPVILSALKASGYSDYLHPLPGGYLLGVGKDAVPSSTGDFAYYLGLKLSLFRVFDNGTSVQVSKLLIGDRGTDSPVLSDHLAFTFDQTRNITVIPLTLYVVSGTQTYASSSPPPYGDPVWQGVYVVSVNSSGLAVIGKVSQYPAGQNYGDSPNSGLQIDRSVIIGDYLYTISQGEVMVSSLTSFSTVSTVQLAS